MKKTYQIVREYNINGQTCECLCYDAGCAITYSEEDAKAKVAKLHEMGYTTARYEEVAPKQQWWNDSNWIG